MKKSTLITIGAVLIIAIGAIVYTNMPQNVGEGVAECIGENSVLYTQLGCHACETQENIFGEDYDSLNVVDCLFNKEECLNEGISATPTWIIEGKKYLGVQSIDKLKELTGC